ncbi:hypothetical protein [Dyadobacter pollutisoli]|uniref:Uncharacterized protein n=1 Tax=Dyadobacter pollutisoli TaxID=2910158 RepID=A0A9E8NB71_9BACT|nr:hypothetical protein [Dyadobacter pollutisoli]WAC13429.1 hypothetical protein ON006_05610 [Dyadobacter pollutisoli]
MAADIGWNVFFADDDEDDAFLLEMALKIRQIGMLSSIMIFMFTGCQDPKTISLAYQRQVDCYLFKPASHDEWEQVLSHAICFAKNI